MTTTHQNPIWRDVFLEIAKRAIIKVHLSHSPWHVKKTGKINTKDIQLLNQGHGALLALETTVASEITNEFINSLLTSNLNIEEKNRLYHIEREKPYDLPTQKKIVDIVIKREGDGFNPVLIELKRYHTYQFEIATGVVKNRANNNDGIKKDIEALRKININNDHFTYILVWGELSRLPKPNSKRKSYKKIIQEAIGEGIKSTDIYLRWFPFSLKNVEKPEVNNWIWIALIEIKQPTDQ